MRFDLGTLEHDGDVKAGNPYPDITGTMWTRVPVETFVELAQTTDQEWSFGVVLNGQACDWLRFFASQIPQK